MVMVYSKNLLYNIKLDYVFLQCVKTAAKMPDVMMEGVHVRRVTQEME